MSQASLVATSQTQTDKTDKIRVLWPRRRRTARVVSGARVNKTSGPLLLASVPALLVDRFTSIRALEIDGPWQREAREWAEANGPVRIMQESGAKEPGLSVITLMFCPGRLPG